MDEHMKSRLERFLYLSFAVCAAIYLGLIGYVNMKGLVFNLYNPPAYRSFVNSQYNDKDQPGIYHFLIRLYPCILMGFALISIIFARKRKESRQDRYCFIAAAVLLVLTIYAHDFMPITDGKKLVKSFMDDIAKGQVHDKSCWGGRWTAFLKVKSPYFDEIIIHNNPTFLRAVVGVKAGKIVTYFLYAEKWDRYKISDVDLIENKYFNESKMWHDLVKKLPESELRTYCWLEKTLSDNFSKIKSNEPLRIYDDVFQQMYDDLVKVLDIVEPNVHHPTSLELTREELRKSSH